MKKSFSTILAITLLQTPLAFAQSTETLVLEKLTPVSVTYSRIHNKVLLGMAEDNGVVSFHECDVPQLAKGQTATLDVISNCAELPGSKFMANDSIVSRINGSFQKNLDEAFHNEQVQANRKREWEENSAKSPTHMTGGIIGMFAGGAGAATGFSGAQKLFKSGKYIRGTGAGVLGAAAGLLALGGTALFVGLVGQSDWRDFPIVSLEDAVTEKLNALIAEGPKQTLVADEKEQKLMYPAVKTAILKSINQAVTL